MYKINTTDFGWNQIDDDFILFSISKNTYYILNETAKSVWEFLYQETDCCQKSDIISYLDQEYDCDNIEKVTQDIEQLMSLFEEIGIVTVI